jgi:hypothetical protein
MTKQQWISMNTDGPNCPLSKVYTRKEAQKLFTRAGFIIKRNYTRYFNKTHYSFLGKLIPHCAANLIGKLWGWHRWIEVTKIHPQMIERSIEKFLSWLRDYGYYSYDHFDFWGSGLGVVAKRAWHSPPTAAPGVSRPTSNDHQQRARRATKSFDQTFSKVWPPAGPPEATNQSKAKKILAAPLVLSLQLLESFFPRSRILFAKKRRFAIGDAHFVQGFVNLYHYYRDPVYRDKAEEILPEIRSSATTTPSGIGWGYPYTWVTGRAIYPSGTPFITVTPYCFDAFLAMYDITGEKKYLDTAKSITRFAANDLNETIISDDETAVSYSPIDNSQVINASAYRAALLLKGFKLFGIMEYKEKAVKNINFVLNQQQADGSWYYAVNERFIDHFHTCFVLKNLYKAYMILKDEKILKAVKKGYGYYREFLFRKDHTPIHFSKRGWHPQPIHGQPDAVLFGTSSQKFADKIKFHQVLLKSINHKFRKIEMYDYAEGIALGPLLNPDIDGALDFSRQLAQHFIDTFQLKKGYFVTRVTSLNSRNKVPYLRWPQAQLFNALTTLLLTYSHRKEKKNVNTRI